MPARKRNKAAGGGAAAQPSGAPDKKAAQRSAAQMFAERQDAERRQQSEEAKVRREAQLREDRRRELVKAKDRAADRLKEVRRRGGSGQERIDAEAAYRASLDAVIRDEQGLPPLEEGSDDTAESAEPIDLGEVEVLPEAEAEA